MGQGCLRKNCIAGILVSIIGLSIVPFGVDGQIKKGKEKDEEEEKADELSLAEQDFQDRLVYGGNLGLSFGNYTSIDVSPKVGYRLNKKWIAGVGFTYHYLKVENNIVGVAYEDNIYGFGAFTNYRLFQQILAVGKMELMNVRPQARYLGETRVWQPGTFLGAGYRQGAGGKVVFDVQLLYNFNHRAGVSPYNSPWVFEFNIFVM